MATNKKLSTKEKTTQPATTDIPRKEALIAQLHELNERSRRYSNQLWQVPFAFFGIVGLVASSLINSSNSIILSIAFASLAGLGIAVTLHIRGMADGHKRAVTNIQRIEQKLELEQTVQYKPWYWLTLYVTVIVVIVLSLFASYYFFTN